MMLSSAGATHPRGWQPNGDPAAYPLGTGYNGDGNVFLTDEDYTIPRFDITQFEEYAANLPRGSGPQQAPSDVTWQIEPNPYMSISAMQVDRYYVPYCAASDQTEQAAGPMILV